MTLSSRLGPSVVLISALLAATAATNSRAQIANGNFDNPTPAPWLKSFSNAPPGCEMPWRTNGGNGGKCGHLGRFGNGPPNGCRFSQILQTFPCGAPDPNQFCTVQFSALFNPQGNNDEARISINTPSGMKLQVIPSSPIWQSYTVSAPGCGTSTVRFQLLGPNTGTTSSLRIDNVISSCTAEDRTDLTQAAIPSSLTTVTAPLRERPVISQAGNPVPGQTYGPIDLDLATTVNGSLGVAELGGIAFVSSRGNNGGTAAPHSLTAIDLATNSVINIAQQSVTADSSAWGYRDGTSDGSVLMFAYDAGVEVIDPSSVLSGTGRVTNVTTVIADNGPQTITNPINAGPTVSFHRGLAYNPSGNGGNGSLWTGNFGSDLWEIDLNGNVLTTWPNGGWSIYGLAWDHLNGTLWCNSAPTNGPLAEIDPATGTLTGRTIERNGPTTAQGGLSWVAGGFDGRSCGSDLLAVDQATPDTLNAYRLQLWDTLNYADERSLLLGVDGGGATPGDKSVLLGTNTSFEIDLSGTPGAAYSVFANLDPAASTPQPYPNPIGAIFPSLIELAVDISAGTLINITPLVSGSAVSLPLAGLAPGKIKLQAISINFGILGGGNPCGLALGVEVSRPSCITVNPPFAGCGVTASANGANSFNNITTSGYFSVLNQTGQDITALTIDAQPIAGTLRFDTDQTGMADRFDAGISSAAGCQNTYRSGSDAATGLVYAGTRLSPGCSGTEIGWNGTAGAATIANDFQVLDFTFTDFNNGETFEFDCDTDGGVGINGGSMAGMTFTVTLADGTVCSGALIANPDPNLSTALF